MVYSFVRWTWYFLTKRDHDHEQVEGTGAFPQVTFLQRAGLPAASFLRIHPEEMTQPESAVYTVTHMLGTML